jgi:hypothetical protein
MLTMNDDGTATISLVSRKVRLRRPTLGEYRSLREQLETMQDDAVDASETLANMVVEQQQIPQSDRLSESAQQMSRRVREQTRTVRKLGEQSREHWLGNVLATLGDVGDITADEYPSDVAGDQWIGQLIEHWRTRPTHPGDN